MRQPMISAAELKHLIRICDAEGREGPDDTRADSSPSSQLVANTASRERMIRRRGDASEWGALVH